MTNWFLKQTSAIPTTVFVLAVASGSLFISYRAQAQTTGDGEITGIVKIDRGHVKAFRVRATDLTRRIAYTVYTNKGQYHVYNLPPGRYEVSVVEEGVQSPNQTVNLTAGQTASVDIALKSNNDVQESVGVSGSRAQDPFWIA